MTAQLVAGLHQYIEALDKQRASMREQADSLNRAWFRTRAVYYGDGADAFEAAYLRSMAMLKSYIDAAEHILPILRERLAALEEFNSDMNPEI